jgi:hypothetical protein
LVDDTRGRVRWFLRHAGIRDEGLPPADEGWRDLDALSAFLAATGELPGRATLLDLLRGEVKAGVLEARRGGRAPDAQQWRWHAGGSGGGRLPA